MPTIWDTPSYGTPPNRCGFTVHTTHWWSLGMSLHSCSVQPSHVTYSASSSASASAAVREPRKKPTGFWWRKSMVFSRNFSMVQIDVQWILLGWNDENWGTLMTIDAMFPWQLGFWRWLQCLLPLWFRNVGMFATITYYNRDAKDELFDCTWWLL